MNTKNTKSNKSSASRSCLARLVRRVSKWAWSEELSKHQNVTEDAQSLVDALLRGETADAYCGYGRDGQASNYRDELKWSLRDLQSNAERERDEPKRNSLLSANGSRNRI